MDDSCLLTLKVIHLLNVNKGLVTWSFILLCDVLRENSEYFILFLHFFNQFTSRRTLKTMNWATLKYRISTLLIKKTSTKNWEEKDNHTTKLKSILVKQDYINTIRTNCSYKPNLFSFILIHPLHVSSCNWACNRYLKQRNECDCILNFAELQYRVLSAYKEVR